VDRLYEERGGDGDVSWRAAGRLQRGEVEALRGRGQHPCPELRGKGTGYEAFLQRFMEKACS